MNLWMKARILSLYLGFVGFLAVVLFRLVQLQVLPNPDLSELAKKQFDKIARRSNYRLPIYDRLGEELAVNVAAGSVFARPKLITRKKDTARQLAQLLGGSPAKWLSRLQTQRPFIWIQRQVSEDLAEKITAAGMRGIFVETENRRVYPNDELAATILGFTDIDGNGITGMELALNSELSLKSSLYQAVKDGKGNFAYIDRRYMKPVESSGIFLTIDRRLQHALEEELERSYRETGSKAVLGAILNPHTGEILAMSQRPTFNPNRAGHSPMANQVNRWTSSLYEPGSTIKVLLAAEAIERKMLQPQSGIDCGNGELIIGNKKIREAEAHHRYGVIPLKEVIQYSSNVGAAKIAHAMGTPMVRSTFEKFGLTGKTNLPFPGELGGNIRPESAWNSFLLATAAFGQGISTTPLQLLAAFAPFANGGFWVRPKLLIREVETATSDRRPVLSPDTVEKMRDILVSVTEEKGGTGVAGKLNGVKVAGKTGTAQKYDPSGGYDSGKYFSSFVGFFPAETPELLVAVMVDEPKGDYYAAKVAVPLFKRVAERALVVLDRTPRQLVAKLVPSPKSTGIPGTSSLLGTALVTEFRRNDDGTWSMPDLSGASLRDALRACGSFFHQLEIQGNGYLSSQTPRPGTAVNPETPVQLTFSPS